MDNVGNQSQEDKDMQAKLDNEKKTITITLPFDAVGRPSATGKTTVHASTNGNQPSAIVLDGRPLVIGVNVYAAKRA